LHILSANLLFFSAPSKEVKVDGSETRVDPAKTPTPRTRTQTESFSPTTPSTTTHKRKGSAGKKSAKPLKRIKLEDSDDEQSEEEPREKKSKHASKSTAFAPSMLTFYEEENKRLWAELDALKALNISLHDELQLAKSEAAAAKAGFSAFKEGMSFLKH
jgi:hypothetical protein